MFSVSWENHDYKCTGGSNGVTVTFTDTDPARGSYTGTLKCYPHRVTPDSMFEVRLSGDFGENL